MTSLEPGVYKLINAQAGTALDLDTRDNKTVQGWARHEGNNQKWTVKRNENHWTLRSHMGTYLGIDLPAGDGVPLVAVNQEFNWDIYDDGPTPDHRRLFIPGYPAPGSNIDLSDHGNIADGTRVTLWTKWDGANQVWRFERA